jgi:hypothetical protein
MISQSLITLVVALALTLGAVCAAQAQATHGAPPPLATEPAPADHTKDIPSDEALLRQHLTGGDSAPSGAVNLSQKARQTPAVAGAPGALQGTREEGSDTAKAVKDFVKPLYQEVSNSEVVRAVREIDATVSGRSEADRANGAPRYDQPGSDAPGSTQAGRKSDPNAAALLWEQLIDEVLPWATGGLVVGLLGYGGYFWFKLIQHKNLKLGDKRRAVRRGRRLERNSERTSERHSERHSTSRTSTGAALVQSTLDNVAAPGPAATAISAPAGSGQPSTSSRSSRSSSRRSSSRTSSRSSSRASNGASDGSNP